MADTKPSTTISEEQFHQDIHNSIGKPTTKYALYGKGKNRTRKAISKQHRCEWTEASVNLKTKNIAIKVFLNFKQNKLSDSDYNRLKSLARLGISQYWSDTISIANQQFNLRLVVLHRTTQATDVNLKIDKNIKYARSHNSGLIDASFIYNKGYHGTNSGRADADFKLVSAHEFGHSILMYFGGRNLSWGHKGSTHPLLQSVKKSTPGYPTTGEIDLMKYYDYSKNTTPVFTSSLESRSKAANVDIKRLIWMSTIKFTK